MGFCFRKSVKIGPFRLNASKSGIGVSAGVKGFRVTKTATGRTRTTASIPGTGISYVQERGKAVKTKGTTKKRRLWIWIVIGVLLVLGAIGSCNNKNAAPAEASPTPTVAATPNNNETTKSQPQAAAEVTPRVYTFILNTSTHKYHDPKCSTLKDLKEENREEFTGTREEVEAMGYEPCGRCGG